MTIVQSRARPIADKSLSNPAMRMLPRWYWDELAPFLAITAEGHDDLFKVAELFPAQVTL
jgi:hypothetical protein